jgi:hypothetical protein
MTMYEEYGITFYPKNTNPQALVQSSQFLFSPNKTAQKRKIGNLRIFSQIMTQKLRNDKNMSFS